MWHMVNEYADADSYIPREKWDVDHILRYWNQEKQNLYHILGNKLQYVIPNVDVSASQEAIERKVRNDVELSLQKQKIESWMSHNTDTESYRVYSQIMSYVGMSSNKVQYFYEKEPRVFSLGDKTLTIPEGMKFSRAIKKMLEFFNAPKELYTQFQRAHSLCLGQKNLRGDLIISIHPLDYMTMSNNGHGWYSCMEWMRADDEGGEYKAGTVEMMNSPYVVVCSFVDNYNYHPSSACRATWNDKIWRELFIVNDTVISEIRPYPFENKELTELCLKTLRDLVEKDKWFGKFVEFNSVPDTIKRFRETPTYHHKYSFITNMMYDDTYGEMLAYESNQNPNSQVNLNFSGKMICMCCGSEDMDIGATDFQERFVACVDCCSKKQSYSCCENCGCYLTPDEANYLGDYQYCDDCICNIATFSDFYGEYIENTELAMLVINGLGDTDGVYGMYIYDNKSDIEDFLKPKTAFRNYAYFDYSMVDEFKEYAMENLDLDADGLTSLESYSLYYPIFIIDKDDATESAIRAYKYGIDEIH